MAILGDQLEFSQSKNMVSVPNCMHDVTSQFQLLLQWCCLLYLLVCSCWSLGEVEGVAFQVTFLFGSCQVLFFGLHSWFPDSQIFSIVFIGQWSVALSLSHCWLFCPPLSWLRTCLSLAWWKKQEVTSTKVVKCLQLFVLTWNSSTICYIPVSTPCLLKLTPSFGLRLFHLWLTSVGVAY